MKKFILIILFLCFYSQSYGDTNSIKYEAIYDKIDSALEKKVGSDSVKKKELYSEIINKIIQSKKKIEKKYGVEKVKLLLDILEYGKNKIVETGIVKKVLLGHSEGGREIFGYYKGDPENGFFGVFANLHGGYEYGTYTTAKHLIEELDKSGKTGWFVIPTLNPDGLDYYKFQGADQGSYLKGRSNGNNVNLNRNFCTKNFQLKTVEKKGYEMLTGIGGCGTEKETKTIVHTLEVYKFHKILSLHSEGGIIYIPDGSFFDQEVRKFGKQLKGILPDYIHNLDYANRTEMLQKIYQYEIDEGGTNNFTGSMETYIYENYKIPVLLIEIEDHGEMELRLANIKQLLK